MKLYSTRNKNKKISFSEGIIKGISDDNGLFVPDEFKSFDFSKKDILNNSYQDTAFDILNKFLGDEFSKNTLKTIINQAYDEKFSNSEIVPLKSFDKLHFMELYHGPTLAFKDMALSILPYLLQESRKNVNLDKDIVILTATSGDTGKAALEGFSDVKDTDIIVFYPKDGVSPIQKRQMITQEGNNTHVFGIEGNFDQAQSSVKEIFTDENFRNILDKNDYIFSSANSINIGRLLPQIIYYIHSYLKLVKENKIKMGDKINIVVPTGNFGNILAAKYAKKMGLPVNKFICASNINNILTDFINTGEYDLHRNFIQTISPSMDILISSNLERLLFDISNQSDKTVNSLMKNLKTNKVYEIDEDMKQNLKDFYGNYSDDEETKNTIKKVYDNMNYLIDPHTAVGYSVYEKYQNENKDDYHTLLASTASPYKFPKSIADVLGIEKFEDDFELINEISKITNVKIPKNISELINKKSIHNDSIKVNEMRNMILKSLNIKNA